MDDSLQFFDNYPPSGQSGTISTKASNYNQNFFKDGQFHRVAWVKKNGYVKLFVDGLLHLSEDFETNTHTGSFTIGRIGCRILETYTMSYWGIIDNLVLLDVGLTDAEKRLKKMERDMEARLKARE